MKKYNKLMLFIALLFASSFVLQGCLKDTCARTYTIYTPVYKSVAEVRANIKNNAPLQVSNPGKMFVQGNYIFLNEIDKGIHVIDNSNPANPINKYFIDIPGNIDLAVKDNTLYADLYSDLLTINIADPTLVKVEKVIEKAFPNRQYVNGFAADQSKIIVDWTKKDTTVECSSTWMGRPGILFLDSRAFNSVAAQSQAKAGVGGSMARFALKNDYLYTVTNSSLNVFNISQSLDPALVNTVPIGWNIETIFPFKDNLFIGSSSGMFIYGTSNPVQPNQLSMFSHARVCDPVIADDNFAFVTLRSGNMCGGFTNQLDVLNISNLSAPTLIKTYQLTNPHGLSKYGDLLFICDGAAGLKVFDAKDVNNLKLLKTISNIDTYDVITYNNIAMVVAKDGLYQYSIGSNNQVNFLSKLSLQRSK